MGVSYWAWFGLLYLCILTFQDFRNNRWVDDRHNYFMGGVTLSLVSHVDIDWTFLLIVIASIFAVSIYAHKTKFMGEGDLHAIMWVFTGFAILGFHALLVWWGVFLAVSALFVLICRWRVAHGKGDGTAPFFWVILLCFFAVSGYLGLIL